MTAGPARPARLPAEPPGSSHFLEPRWPVVAGVLLAVLLYATLPERLTLGPTWLVPLVECALLLPLLLSEPHWHAPTQRHWQRWVAIALFGLINLANLVSLVLVVQSLLGGRQASGGVLIIEAMKIWLTNVVVFSFWYWELDRGGPRARHWREERVPDFLFPQMSSPAVAPAGWMPTFVDYVYVSLTNALAFSPTDTLPLTPRAKVLMGVQALISLLTVALVAARAVNILG